MLEQRDVRLSSKYEALLRSLNYDINNVEDSAVYFADSEGFIYVLSFDDKTPNYLSVGFGISGFQDDQDLVKRYTAVQYVNEEIKRVKVYFQDESAQFSCEQLMYDVANLRDFIDASIVSMHVAYKELIRNLRPEE